MTHEATKVIARLHHVEFPDGTTRTHSFTLSFIAESDMWNEALDNAIEHLHNAIHNVFGTPPIAFIYTVESIETIEVDDDGDEYDEEE